MAGIALVTTCDTGLFQGEINAQTPTGARSTWAPSSGSRNSYSRSTSIVLATCAAPAATCALARPGVAPISAGSSRAMSSARFR